VHNLVCITDTSGVIAYVNDAFCRASGYKRRELLGQGFGLLKSGVHSAEFYAKLWQALREGEVWRGEFCNRRKDGSLYWVDTSIVPYQDEGGRPTRFLGVGTDVSRLKALEQALGPA
jgi:PAS domain S-box-containing protein